MQKEKKTKESGATQTALEAAQRLTERKAATGEVAAQKYAEDAVSFVTAEFERRREERLPLERQWELNMNFLLGNQYCLINGMGEIAEDGSAYYWQNRRVFNHIAPVVETRLAKFARICPTVGVRPQADDDDEVAGATAAEKLIATAFKTTDVNEVVRKATSWSETCGTSFYKVVWDGNGGNKVGELDGVPVYEGDVAVLPLSPFELFPDSIYTENLDDCASIIHAKAMSVEAVKEKYGVQVKGGPVGVFSLHDGAKARSCKEVYNGVLDGAVTVIEYYEKPTSAYPMGKLITVAGDKLLYYGELPYGNGKNGTRGYPFIRQLSVPTAGRFFGTSIIERLIPVQRAYNAVKNRKHEFLNRLSMGIMKVEDGSMDVDDLTEDGLSPGKVLVYRQGSAAPEMLGGNSMPGDFNEEEKRLLNEFVVISGVSDVTSSSSNASLSSGTALELLIEQDNERLMTSAEAIRKSYLEIARHVVRLYAQFLSGVKALTYRNADDKVKILYIDPASVHSDEVYLENENELLYTERQRKDVLLSLYNSGLLADEKGEVRQSTKEKLLTLLGYKDLDYRKGLSRLHEEKAQAENEALRTADMPVEEIDDHRTHEETHVRFVLSEYVSLSDEQKARYFEHVRVHRQRLAESSQK